MTDGYFMFFPIPNNHTSSFISYGHVAHSSLVQVCNFVPDNLWQLSGLTHGGGGEAGMEEADSVYKGVLYTQTELRSICNWLIPICERQNSVAVVGIKYFYSVTCKLIYNFYTSFFFLNSGWYSLSFH